MSELDDLSPTSGQRCSVLAAAAGEPLPGTAVVAPSWLVVEDPGPWGRDALHESTVPADVARSVQAVADGVGARVQLVRRPDRSSTTTARRVLWAVTGDRAELRDLGRHDDAGLADLDLAAPATRAERPVYLVCTHAKRDVCCAVFGRPLVNRMVTLTDAPVWETSHTGGHRFAGVIVVLPWGLTYGRITPEDLPELVAATDRGEVLLRRYRGRSSDSHPAQVADAAVRRHTDQRRIDAVRCTSVTASVGAATAIVEVTAAPGDTRSFTVELTMTTLDEPRPASCGKPEETPTVWSVAAIR